jgi:hypothetical protein
MASLRRLIRGQDIAFDTHQAGDGQEVRFEDLHLEKRLWDGGWKVRFPLFGDRQPTRSKTMPEEDYQRVVKEVKKALKDNDELTQELAETIVRQLRRFKNSEISVEVAVAAASKIAENFGLGKPFVARVKGLVSPPVELVSTLHFERRGAYAFEIVQSANSIQIRRAENSWNDWGIDGPFLFLE